MVTVATDVDMKGMIKHALPNLMTSARHPRAGVKDTSKGGPQVLIQTTPRKNCPTLLNDAAKKKNENGLPSPRTVRKIVQEVASNVSICTAIPTTEEFPRRRSHGDCADQSIPILQRNRSESPTPFSLSQAAQGVFNAKTASHIMQNGRRVSVGLLGHQGNRNRSGASTPDIESGTQSSCEGDSDSQSSKGGVNSEIMEPDAEPDSKVAEERQTCFESHELNVEHVDESDEKWESPVRFHMVASEEEASSTQRYAGSEQVDLTKKYEVEKQNLTARFMGARQQVEQLKHKSDQKSAELIAEQRFRKEAEEELARLRSKCQMQEEGKEELRRNMHVMKEQVESKYRLEKEKVAKENYNLKRAKAQLAKDNLKLQRELAQLAQLRSKGGNEKAKSGSDNLAAKVVDMECLPLKSCAPEERASLKKKLLLKWHPDKQPSSELALFATQVVQEMQNRSVWKD